jgi:hypothetical protein
MENTTEKYPKDRWYKSCEECLVQVLDQRGQEHKLLSELLEEQSILLSSRNLILEKVEENTKEMVAVFEHFRQDQKDMIDLIAGKKQVPLNIFTTVILLLSILLFLTWADNRWGYINITPSGIQIEEHHNKPQQTSKLLEWKTLIPFAFAEDK